MHATFGELPVLRRIAGVGRLARGAGRVAQQAELQHLKASELAERVGVREPQQRDPVAHGIGDQDRPGHVARLLLRPEQPAGAGEERQRRGRGAAHDT